MSDIKITQDQLDKFNEIFKEKGRTEADAYAQPIISSFGLDSPAERGKLWNLFLEKQRAEISAELESKAKALRKAKREISKNKAKIKKVCETILSKYGLSDYERKFLNDIKTKRKLTEKQESWLRSLAQKNNVEINGNIENRVSRREISQHCEHDDLGSLGYTHGSTVRCPHCGELAEVW